MDTISAPRGFESVTTDVGGLSLHSVIGGAGPALLLVHGFPQDWYEWRTVMGHLAEASTVVAVDLRGVGGSDAPDHGYDAATMAGDLVQLVDHLDLGPVDIVGHDVGGWVAYAFARLHPATTRSTTIVETLIPGVEPFAEAHLDVPMWHGEFHMIPDLPEELVADRQEAYFRYFFEIGTRRDDVISDEDLRHYAVAYGDPAHLRAAFEMYRALPQNVAVNAAQREPTDIPLLLVGGEHVFGPALEDVAANLHANFGWNTVEVEILPDAQHYVVEERPHEVVALIERQIARRTP